ncbi:hypothetical protein [Allobaculum sp. JKK-2023]|uniref:hypothetical protein n=1 Tax=Allobaculum sp. JKK-2023 TaxID=3108943 RepID=UPI002B0591A8|nr:hypothetical protein [Allobaculum sp. JKK-2023]
METTNLTEEQKYNKMVQLYNECRDYFLRRYMKLSYNAMDRKIRVLQARVDGKTPPEIGPDWDAVQEED